MDELTKSFERRQTVGGVLSRFAGETTAHGIPRIIDRPRYISKVFWLIIVVVAFSIFVHQTVNVLTNYYAFNTKINLINSQEIEFPAITVCNLNRMKRSLLATNSRWIEAILQDEMRNYQTETLMQGPTPETASYAEESYRKRKKRYTNDDYEWYYDSFEEVVEESGPFLRDYSDSGNITLMMAFPPAADIAPGLWQAKDVPDPTVEELRDMGHQAEDLIVDCRFNNRKCDYRDFTVMQNKYYGNCFTFNGDLANITSPARITKAGSNFGLHLTMFIEENEYTGFLTEEYGVRVMAHQRNIMPHPEDVGMSVPPGQSTNIGIRQVELVRLKHPYGNCTDGDGLNYLSSQRYSYNILSCQKKCLLDKLEAECGCVTDIYDDYRGLPQCNRTNRVCRQGIEQLYYQNILNCDCPASCREFVYNIQTSASVWPTESSFTYLKEKLRDKRQFDVYQDAFPDASQAPAARKNLVRIKVYFQELNYELVEQVPAYTIDTVLGNIGGLLGLYVGFSLITVSEIVVLIYDLLILLCKKTFPKNNINGNS